MNRRVKISLQNIPNITFLAQENVYKNLLPNGFFLCGLSYRFNAIWCQSGSKETWFVIYFTVCVFNVKHNNQFSIVADHLSSYMYFLGLFRNLYGQKCVSVPKSGICFFLLLALPLVQMPDSLFHHFAKIPLLCHLNLDQNLSHKFVIFNLFVNEQC